MSTFDDSPSRPERSPVPPHIARAARRWKSGVERIDRPTRVLLRDFAIFEVKLLLDTLKGVVVSQAALAALVADLVLNRPRGRPARWFYLVLDFGEWTDRWLDLYGASQGAEDDPEGLFGQSRAGAPTLLGFLEHIADQVFSTPRVVAEPIAESDPFDDYFDDGEFTEDVEEAAGEENAAPAAAEEAHEEPPAAP